MKKSLIVSFCILLLFSIKANALVLALIPALLGADGAITVATAASVAIHAAILAVTFSSSGSPAPPASSDFTVHISKNSPTSLPAGWTASANPQAPTPPLLISQPVGTWGKSGDACVSTSVVGFCGCTFSQASQPNNGYKYVAVRARALGSGYVCDFLTVTATPSTAAAAPTWSPVSNPVYYPANSSCPTGYSASSGQCAASANAATYAVKPPDGKVELVPTPYGYYPDSKDGDIASDTDVTYSTNQAKGTNVTTVNSPDGGKTEIAYNPTTKATNVTTTTPSNTSPGMSDVVSYDISAPDASGNTQVSGVSKSTVSGSGTSAGSASGSGSSTVNCAGCATEATQQQVLSNVSAIKSNTASIKDSLNSGTDTNSEAKIAEAGASLDARENAIKNTGGYAPDVNSSWIPNFLPGSSTVCKPIPLDFTFTNSKNVVHGVGAVGYIDICDKLDFARQLLGYVIGLFTLFYVLRLFFRSNVAKL